MALPTIQLTLKELRQRTSRLLDDLILFSCSGGTAGSGATNGTITAIGDLERHPTTPSALKGAEVSNITISTPESRRISDHSFSDPTVTLTIAGNHTSPTSADVFEIHDLGGKGFTKAQYDDAIKYAIASLADSYWTDADSVPFGFEYTGEDRAEYPVPASLIYLYGVYHLFSDKTTGNALSNANMQRDLGRILLYYRVSQGFKVGTSGWYEWISVAALKVGSPTDSLILSIMSNSSGLPSVTGSPPVTTLTDATSDLVLGSTLDKQARYIPFRFSRPIYLTAGTQYHWSLARNGSTSDTNYYRVLGSSTDTYGDGNGSFMDHTETYYTLAPVDFCFAVFKASSRWIPLRPRDAWQYRRIGTDVLYFPYSYSDGTPMRIVGGTAIAEPTSETTTIPIPPEYAVAKALEYLLTGRSGRILPENYAASARSFMNLALSKPRPLRALPPNSVRVNQ